MAPHDAARRRARLGRRWSGRPWVLGLGALAALAIAACDSSWVPNERPRALACREVDRSAEGPTLECRSESGDVSVRIPWQGQDVQVWQWPLESYGDLPSGGEFRPLSDAPLMLVSIAPAGTLDPLTTFDPPVTLSVRYGPQEFARANPRVGEAELALGVWDAANRRWIVVGQAVFHEGFWLADPITVRGIELVADVTNTQPRFQLTGTPSGGAVSAVIGVALPALPLAWGAVPYAAERRLTGFDGPCTDVLLDGVAAVECVSEEAGITLRVPAQDAGRVRPQVIALPWNKASTFIPTDVDDLWGIGIEVTELRRSLMNFLIVDADEPTRVLFDFDPPIEFEVVYAPEDKDPAGDPILRVSYWDEYVERFVVLGEGPTAACIGDDGVPRPGCTWGEAVEAEPTSDPAFGGRFFRGDDQGMGGGVAKFTYHRWGDRMVMFGR